MFLDSENELFYDHPYDTVDSIVDWSQRGNDERVAPQLAVAAVSTCQQKGVISTGETISKFECNAIVVLDGKGPASILPVRGVDTLLIELCASETSELTPQVPYRFAYLRITEKHDLNRSATVKAMISIIRAAHERGVKINVWASIPCTSSCPWRHFNATLGRGTGDQNLSDTLIEHASRMCRFAYVCGGHFTWEWPERSFLWQDRRIRKLISVDGYFVHVSASGVGWFTILKGKEVSVKKKFKIWTTDDSVAKAFFPYHSDPNSKRKTFVECLGEVAERIANYTKLFVEIYWRSQFYRRTNIGALVVNHEGFPNACQRFHSPSERVFGDGHREIDSRPNKPIWRSQITRVVKPKSAEARCEGAAKAIRKELSNMNFKNAWDT